MRRSRVVPEQKHLKDTIDSKNIMHREYKTQQRIIDAEVASNASDKAYIKEIQEQKQSLFLAKKFFLRKGI